MKILLLLMLHIFNQVFFCVQLDIYCLQCLQVEIRLYVLLMNSVIETQHH